MPTVSKLFIHPVKSCRAHEVTKLPLDSYGATGDRRWIIVNLDGTPITQRDTPKMATLDVNVLSPNCIKFSHSCFESLQLEFDLDSLPDAQTTVWGTECIGKDLGDTVANWLEMFLEKPARLVGMGSNFTRPIKNLPSRLVSFADSYPILIVSEASLSRLNDDLQHPVGIDRFRPNIVIADCEAFAEDSWKKIKIGEAIFSAAGHSKRCSMITVDQAKGERCGKEPLATLTKLRKNISSKPIFGQNYINESTSGSIELGMSVQVVE
ncbi:MOSC domain-containing protein [Puniceicoccaceae bacterium K14]|nr:MOSC domain-containing protein [Puniceicoccaceae bacterium K14]